MDGAAVSTGADGKPCGAALLLPGFMLDRRMWAAQEQGLSDLAALHHGDLTCAETMGGIAQGVLAAAPGQFHLIGFSMGAIVGMEVLRRAPERVLSLVLIGFSPRADAPERRPHRLADAARAEAGDLMGVLEEGYFPRYFAADSDPDGALRRQVAQTAEELGPQAFARQSRAQMDRADSVPTLGTIRVPTLVACGRHDALVPVAEHEMVAARTPGAVLQVVEASGHVVPMEQPAAMNALLREFLLRHAART